MATYKVRNEAGQDFDVEETNLDAAEKDGYLPVVTNGKEEHRVSHRDMPVAAKDGYKPLGAAPASEAIDENAPSAAPVDVDNAADAPKIGAGESMLRGAAQAPFAIADEAYGVLGAIVNPADSDKGLIERYLLSRDYARGRDQQAEKDHKGMYMTGNVLGGLATGGALGMAAKGTGKIADVAKVLAPKDVVGLKGLGNMVKAGAAGGAATGLGTSTADDPLGVAADTAAGGAIGGVLGIPAWLLGAGSDKTLKTGAKGIAKFLGRGSDVSDPYLANPGKYNNPDLNWENVQDMIAGPANKAATAQDELAAIAGEAKDVAKTARAEHIQRLRDTNVGQDAVDSVRDSLKAQRGKTSELANQQLGMLEPVADQYPIGSLDSVIVKGLEREKIAGVTPSNENVKALGSFQDLLDQFKSKATTKTTDVYDPSSMKWNMVAEEVAPEATKLRPADMVKLRQNVDSLVEGTFDKTAGAYDERYERIAKQLRAEINNILDSQLPNDVKYAETRKLLAEASKLGGKASEVFGGDNAMSRLAGLANPNNAEQRQLLSQLDKSTGAKTSELIRPYLDAKAALRNPVELDKTIGKLPPAQMSRESDDFLNAAKQENQLFKDIGDPQAAMRKVMFSGPRKPEIETKALLDQLSKRESAKSGANVDILGNIDDLRVKSAFEGGGPNGSRIANVLANFGAAAGRGATKGSATGASVGRAIGGFVGGTLDYGTGKAAKAALDGYLATKGMVANAATTSVRSAIEALGTADDPISNKFMALLDKAAERGPDAVMATHSVLMKDPEYAKRVGAKGDGQP